MDIKEITRSKSFLVAGHRGACHMYPENTLISLQAAVDMGVDMVELDIALSKDKIPVLCHDRTLERTTTGAGPVSDYTYEELLKFDAGIKMSERFAGTPIPPLSEVFDWALNYPELLLNLDMKSGDSAYEAIEYVISLVKEYRYENRCVFNSGDDRITDKIHGEFGLMTEGGLSHFVNVTDKKAVKLDALCLHIREVNAETVKQYKQIGKLVWCWGTDEPELLSKAMDCGITLAVCNDPMTCISLVKKRIS